MKNQRPYFLKKGKTIREWKAKKRKELKEVLKAVSEYQTGCAYCPGYETDTDELFKILKKMKESHSFKNWG